MVGIEKRKVESWKSELPFKKINQASEMRLTWKPWQAFSVESSPYQSELRMACE